MIKKIFFICTLLLGGGAAFLQTIQQPRIAAGKKVYTKNCLACHQANGAGVPGLNPPLIKTDWVLGEKKRLINVVLNGLDDAIEVNGEEYENPMPALEYLSDQDIADVLTYVRNAFGNKASFIEPSEVKAIRKKK
jgi:mono/diheme cytochrome c family protein